MANELEEQGFEIDTEATFPTPESSSGMAFRRADVFAVNPETQEATIVQVVRTSDAGGVTPYAREFDAMSDILGSTRYQDLINQGYTVNAYMVRRGATSLGSGVLRTF